MSAVTILALAQHRLGHDDSWHELNGADFERAELPIMGGCAVCGATVAAYNACPSRSGFLKCANGCIDDDGFATAAEANDVIFAGSLA